ncbi:hypothetical protein C8J57DRAFT_1248071 [Mycena rebaudengoi]|nr:hypothetical protein C8J57DRAFT_1248071 [Mycena rebaudengoi]
MYILGTLWILHWYMLGLLAVLLKYTGHIPPKYWPVILAIVHSGKKRKLVRAIKTLFSQSRLKVFKGNNIPFSGEQKGAIAHHTVRKSSGALDVGSGVRMVGAAIGRMQWVVSKSLLTSILCINKWQKDGESLKQQFEEMIDEAERTLECNVIGFLTDNDGGSKKAQTLLEAARAWLLTFPCCTHQGQLLLGDYLKENEDATILMGKLIDFVNWLNSHDKVRDDKQQEMLSKTLAYLIRKT